MKKISKKWHDVGVPVEFNGDILITDPCYLCQGGSMEWDPEAWESGEVAARYGGIGSRTYYGDWGCTLYRTDKEAGRVSNADEKIGHFCADAGLVCVIDVAHVRELSPGFEAWLKEHDWCGTIVRNFKGTVRFIKHTTVVHGFNEVELHVRGDGEIDGSPASFESMQTEA